MKPISHCPHGRPAFRGAGSFVVPAVLAALLAAPVTHAQNNAPVTGSMLQETPEQRARIEQAAREAQAEEQARRAAAARPASSVVRQVPGPGQAPAASARPASAARPPVVQAQEQRVTTVVTPQAASQPAPAPAPAAARPQPVVAAAAAYAPGRNRPNGDVTSEALRMQAEGRHAGQALPMLGATAAPSWKRYVDSFSHPVPEFYETTSRPKQ